MYNDTAWYFETSPRIIPSGLLSLFWSAYLHNRTLPMAQTCRSFEDGQTEQMRHAPKSMNWPYIEQQPTSLLNTPQHHRRTSMQRSARSIICPKRRLHELGERFRLGGFGKPYRRGTDKTHPPPHSLFGTDANSTRPRSQL